MMKLVLLITALLFLVYSVNGLICYKCKTPNIHSFDMRFNTGYEVCNEDIEKSQRVEERDDSSPVCKKIIEKINDGGVLIIRTSELKDKPLNLSKQIFEEYDCKSDLCNTGAYLSPAWLTLLLSIPAVMSLNL